MPGWVGTTDRNLHTYGVLQKGHQYKQLSLLSQLENLDTCLGALQNIVFKTIPDYFLFSFLHIFFLQKWRKIY